MLREVSLHPRNVIEWIEISNLGDKVSSSVTVEIVGIHPAFGAIYLSIGPVNYPHVSPGRGAILQDLYHIAII